MKNRIFNFRPVVPILGVGVAFFLIGCGNSAQQQAYEQATKAEQQLSMENASAIVAEYQRVIALQPGSEWARQAQARITTVEIRIKAEELHKSVFQEHGVD